MTNDVPGAAQDEIPKKEWPQKGARGAKKREARIFRPFLSFLCFFAANCLSARLKCPAHFCIGEAAGFEADN
jgi:hypothetical protein